MSLPGNGKYVVRGEMNLMITALRRGAVRWSSNHSSDEEKDSVLKQFIELKKSLDNIDDLRDIHPNVFLNPFLELIRTDQTTGAVTSLALVAVNKFLSYGLIDPTHPNLPIIVENIADAVTHARFMGTDQASDGVTLLRVVQVLHTLIKSPEGNALTNESVCEFMLSCFKICFEPRLNDLLRKTAENALKDMVLLLFMRLPQFSPDSVITSPNTATSAKLKKFQMMATKLDHKESTKWKASTPAVAVTESSPQPSAAADSANSHLLGVKKQVLATTPTTPAGNILDMQGKITQTPTTTREVEPAKEEVTTPVTTVPDDGDNDEKESEGDYVNSVGIRFTQQESIDLETLSSNTESLIPYGLPCIQELFKFLILLCNPLDKQNSDIMIHIGLNLLTVAFEVAAENIGKYDGLLLLVKDELCRNLFALMSTERTSIFATNLHLCFLIFESLRHHLKFQMETYFSKLSEIITSDNPKLPYEMREISLDNIVQLWKIPGFVAELYVNYDCDLYATNLFEDLTKLMSKNTLSAANSIYSTHVLSLDALLSVIENIEKNCVETDDRQSTVSAMTTATQPVSSSYGYGTHSRNNSSISEIIIEDGTNKTSISAIHVPIDTVENISSFMAKSSPDTKCELPKDTLLETKKKKQIISQGTEFFNQKPEKGILYLQENGILNSSLDPKEVAAFLRENPGLDKRHIGDFITKKKSEDAGILECFVKSFNFTNLRIDSALRLYLETFRLPGEAPLIFKVMEHFSEHWHIQNGEPFANPDAAFRLAYAIIMLNMDQHNTNAKKLNVPMTPEDFQKNLRGLNGNEDFDQEMLLEIYNSIKNEEIIMPAEQTGIVRENFLWKVLLRRGLTAEGVYHNIPDSSFDKEVFKVLWGPSLAVLSFMNDKSTEIGYQRTLKGFIDCASITAHYKLNEDFDALILTLCKFTNLLGIQLDISNELQAAVNFGINVKAQSSLKAVFMLIRKYGDQVVMKESWKNVLDVILQLFRLKFLSDSIVKVEDFCSESEDKKTSLILYKRAQKSEAGIFSSLYSYLSSEGQREPTFDEQKVLDKAKKCVNKCQIDSMFEDTKFIRKESLNELLRVLLSWIVPPESHKTVDLLYSEDLVVFWMEILVRVVTQNRDRILPHWESIRDKMYSLILSSAAYGYEYLLNRSIIAVFKLVIDLMRNEELCSVVLQSLKMLLMLKANLIQHVSKQISTGVYELLNKSMYVIHDECDWQIIFTLLEVVGAGAIPPEWTNTNEDLDVAGGAKSDGAISSEDESTFPDRGYISDSEIQQNKLKPQPVVQPISNGENWILVSNSSSPRSQSPTPIGNDLTYPCSLSSHRPYALFKCGESLSLIVRSPVHITPHNFEALVRCMRIFVECSLNGGIKEREKLLFDQKNVRRKDIEEENPLSQRYVGLSIQLLDLLYLLYTYTAKMFTKWDNVPCSILWAKGWRPLLQGIARFVMDHREGVRYYAISSLQQKALLFHDIQTLSGNEWDDCFRQVLFPLLNEHLPESTSIKNLNQKLLEDSRSRVATIMSKTFLHHLTPLIKLPNFIDLWLKILDYVEKFMKIGSDVLHEQMMETLKNILLVMHSVGVFHTTDGSSGYAPLWSLTWNRINEFLPSLKNELFKEETVEVLETTNGYTTSDASNNIDVIQQQVIEPQVVQPNPSNKESILLQTDGPNPLITPVPLPVILPEV